MPAAQDQHGDTLVRYRVRAEVGPGDLPAPLQAQYWNAQNSMLKYKENSGDLWRTQKVVVNGVDLLKGARRLALMV